MDLQWSDESGEARFAAYVGASSGCLGHADRVAPMRSYCTEGSYTKGSLLINSQKY